jgi:hypothetical protein
MAWYDDLLGGNGSLADELNSSGAGDNYIANQSPLDAIDNGYVSQSDDTTTVSPPSWWSSLTSIFGTATQVYGAVKPLIGSTTALAATVATLGAGTPGSSLSSLFSGKALYIVLGVAALILGAFLFFKKH